MQTNIKKIDKRSEDSNRFINMASLPLTILCVLVTVSTAAKNPIREHPHSVLATEGSWANFTCSIKLPGNIKWRIGDLTNNGIKYNSEDKLPLVEGVTAKEILTISKAPVRQIRQTISILATEEMDGTPVQCMFDHPSNDSSRNSYSMFALLNVQLQNITAEGSGEY